MAELLPRLVARWPWVLLGLLIGMAFGFYQVWKSVPLFKSTSVVLVRDRSTDVLGQIDAVEFDVRNNQAMATISNGLTSLNLCERVASLPKVRSLEGLMPKGPKKLPFLEDPAEKSIITEVPPPDHLAGLIRGWLAVSIRPETRLIDVSVTHEDPNVAKVIANQIVEQYIETRTKSRTGEQKDTLEVVQAEARVVQQELQEARNVLAGYASPLSAEKALAAAEADLSRLGLRYGKMHPKMIEAEERVRDAQERFRSVLLRSIHNPVDVEYWEERGLKEAALSSIEELNQARDMLIARNSVLADEINTISALYTSLLARIKNLSFKTGNTEAEVTLEEPARHGGQVAPDKQKLLFSATFAGLFGGAFLALVLQFFDNKIHEPDELENLLDAPVLAVVAELDEKSLSQIHSSDTESNQTRVLSHESWARHLIFRNEASSSPFLEMFRVMRTSLGLLGPADSKKITVVSSAVPSEGKSFVASNLALSFAQQGLRTLLIDFDLRKPSIHKLFGRKRNDQIGLLDVLLKRASVDQATSSYLDETNLSVMFSGAKAPNPGELFESSRLAALFNEVFQKYDRVIVDSAPLLAVPDTRNLAPFCQNFVLVVKANSTSRRLIKGACRLVEAAGASVSGTVLNSYRDSSFLKAKFKKGYGYGGYGYGSSYGTVYGDDSED
ncbi:MAG: polysaccharide biosynthesis tyrosine autokinase [Verrucomicrobiota bacterium JB023]|nr:polysaccharide biosynthesis tyrosine autokinase [Verrucomicrobiota bacterium JB023]